MSDYCDCQESSQIDLVLTRRGIERDYHNWCQQKKKLETLSTLHLDLCYANFYAELAKTGNKI